MCTWEKERKIILTKCLMIRQHVNIGQVNQTHKKRTVPIFFAHCLYFPGARVIRSILHSSDIFTFSGQIICAIPLMILLILEFISSHTHTQLIWWSELPQSKLIPMKLLADLGACARVSALAWQWENNFNLRYVTLLEFNLDREPNALAHVFLSHSSCKWKWCNDKWSRY